MKRAKPGQPPVSDLRRRAQARWQALRKDKVASSADKNTQRQIEELQIHQIELELQNEELFQARDALKASNEKFVELYDFAPASYLTLDADGVIREANLTAATYLGVERSRLIGRAFAPFVAAESRMAFDTFCQLHAGNDNVASCEVALAATDGHARRVRLEARQAPPGPGNAWQRRLTIIDVTEREKTEHALRTTQNQQVRLVRQLEAEHARLVEAQMVARTGSWETVLPGLKVTWTQETHRIFGTDPARFAPSHEAFLDFVHPDDRAMVDAAFVASLESRLPEVIVHRIVTADGHEKIVEERWQAIDDEGGRAARVVGTCRDISDISRAQQALLESELRLSLALDAAHAGTFDWNISTDRIVWSRWHEEMWGFAPGEFSGTYAAFASRVNPQDLLRVNAEVQRCLAQHDRFEQEFRVVWPDGSTHWIDGRGEFARDDNGQPVRMVGVVMEITGRKQAEETLRASEEQYRQIAELSPDAITIHQDGRWVFVNEATVRIFGAEEPSELIGKLVLDFTHPDSHSLVSARLKTLYEDKQPVAPHELKMIRIDGSVVDMETHSTPMLWQGRPAAQVIARDVSERKRSEAERKRLSEIIESSLNEIYLFDAQTLRFQDVNQGARQNLGYTLAQLQAMTPLDLKPEFTEASYRQMLRPLLQGEQPKLVFEAVQRRADASRYPVEVHMQPVEKAGRRALLAVILDITERRRAEAAFAGAQRLLRSVLDATPTIIFAKDIESRILLANEALARFYDTTVEALSGQLQTEMHVRLGGSEADLERWLAEDRKVIETHAVIREVQQSRCPADRALGWYEVVKLPLQLPDGSTGVLVLSENISRRIQAEEELRQMALRLLVSEDIERRRIAAELHDTTAQDLVAAMMIIETVIEMESADDTDRRTRLEDSLALVEKSTHDIRTLSYILHPPRLDEAGLADAIRHYATGFAERSGIAIELALSGNVGRLGMGQEMALFRVVQESLSNINRHSGSKTASIRLERSATEIVVEIRDAGCGLPAAFLHASAGKELGSGVGIAAMRERMRQIGGQLQLESGPHGTTVRAVLPMDETKQ